MINDAKTFVTLAASVRETCADVVPLSKNGVLGASLPVSPRATFQVGPTLPQQLNNG
jgi:hypothetical protein